MLNERQDYFGQTVNIASRVQHLALSQATSRSCGGVLDASETLKRPVDLGAKREFIHLELVGDAAQGCLTLDRGNPAVRQDRRAARSGSL